MEKLVDQDDVRLELMYPTSFGDLLVRLVSPRAMRTQVFNLHDFDDLPPQTARPYRSRKRARIAATDEAILSLRQVTDREGEECATCLNDFRAEEALRAMPCSHTFHN